jgi:DNA-binding MltR family transcriptional regulator
MPITQRTANSDHARNRPRRQFICVNLWASSLCGLLWRPDSPSSCAGLASSEATALARVPCAVSFLHRYRSRQVAKSLRHVIRKPVRAKHVYKFIDQQLPKSGRDFRSFVITSTALLEVGVERLLRSRMRRLDSDDDNSIFGPIGSLSGFAAKIRLAYAFGIIGPISRKDLATINDIRNVFAHSPHNVTFKDKALFARLKTIRIIEAVTIPPGFLTGTKGIKLDSKESAFQEAVFCYMMMLCTTRFKKKILPAAISKIWGIQNCTLRF